MTDPQPLPPEGCSSLADIVAMASHGTVVHPAAVAARANDILSQSPEIRREGLGDHGAPNPPRALHSLDRRRLLAAADDLSRALGRINAALGTGATDALPDAIAAARNALAHLIAVR